MKKSIKEARPGVFKLAGSDNSRAIHAEFTYREWDTVLAALRFWQKVNDDKCIVPIDEDGLITAVHVREYEASADIATEHGNALSKEAIDKLCERIDCRPKPRERKAAKKSARK